MKTTGMFLAAQIAAAAVGLAGCANPYAYSANQAIHRPAPVHRAPAYQPPPVVFKPNPPPTPEATPEPAYSEPLPKDLAPASPPVANTQAAPATAAQPVAVQKPVVPAKGADVPMMGFRPMKGQKTTGSGA